MQIHKVFTTRVAVILFFLTSVCLVDMPVANAQTVNHHKLSNIYRATPDKMNDLIHTKLDIRFDYNKRYLYGREWVTIKPHFYPTDSVKLDAKGMKINALCILIKGRKVPLKYKYDGRLLKIKLDREYKRTEKYILYINYISKPDELKLESGPVITNAKGLFFINPDSTEKGKPVQIWTQSCMESASVWFPTIDKPNQKTTQELSMTVPSKYVTLSNGQLRSQKKNADGTRTDTWKMVLPHSPYLFMMAVGNFRIYKDKWRNLEVNYYLEPDYAPFAKEIFGSTPKMLDYFSKTLGVDYPWNKYSQIVVRDFVSGAMENTTATLHIEYVQRTARELLDSYYDEGQSIIAHELCHHWFGDYVTTESWSNISVNESFADFGEMLWAEHFYGQDAGDDHNNKAMELYLRQPETFTNNLVRFNYTNDQEVFDVVSYQKGGRILNMLRNFLGPQTFFAGIKKYLKKNAFRNAEVHQLRLAMEEASGKDLNWFFNQWFYGAGHPLLDISYQWNESTKTQLVVIKQKQKGNIFLLPMAIDIYSDNQKERKQIWLRNRLDTFAFKVNSRPQLINVDADKIILNQKSDHKSIEDFLFQYRTAPLFMDRSEAIEAAGSNKTNLAAQKILFEALKDQYYGLRLKALSMLSPEDTLLNRIAMPTILKMAKSDTNSLVRAAAITTLSKTKIREQYLSIYQEGIKNQSYKIAGASLNAIAQILPQTESITLARALKKDSSGDLASAIITVFASSGTETECPYVYDKFKAADPESKSKLIPVFIFMVTNLRNPLYTQQGLQILTDVTMEYKSEDLARRVLTSLQQMKEIRQKRGDHIAITLIDTCIRQIKNIR